MDATWAANAKPAHRRRYRRGRHLRAGGPIFSGWWPISKERDSEEIRSRPSKTHTPRLSIRNAPNGDAPTTIGQTNTVAKQLIRCRKRTAAPATKPAGREETRERV